MERPPDSIEGIPVALRFLPLIVLGGWVVGAVYGIAYLLSH